MSIAGLTARWDFVPHWIAEAVELVPKVSPVAVLHLPFQYLFTLSVALAALNAVPCYYLDGQFIVTTVVKGLFPMLPKRRRSLVSNLVLVLGSLLLTANILIGFIRFSLR